MSVHILYHKCPTTCCTKQICYFILPLSCFDACSPLFRYVKSYSLSVYLCIENIKIILIICCTCFRFLWRDSFSEADALGDTIYFIHDENVDVILGSPRSSCTVVFTFNCSCNGILSD